MFRKKQWSFTGTSGAKYVFNLLKKSDGLPQAPGVFILAYTHPRGHRAGWQVNPLLLEHGDDMRDMLGGRGKLDHDQKVLWNSNFVLVEADETSRKQCADDLKSVSVFLG